MKNLTAFDIEGNDGVCGTVPADMPVTSTVLACSPPDRDANGTLPAAQSHASSAGAIAGITGHECLPAMHCAHSNIGVVYNRLITVCSQ